MELQFLLDAPQTIVAWQIGSRPAAHVGRETNVHFFISVMEKSKSLGCKAPLINKTKWENNSTSNRVRKDGGFVRENLKTSVARPF